MDQWTFTMHCLSVVIRKESYFIRQPCHKTAFESISFGKMHEQDIVAVDLDSILMGCFLHVVICKDHPPGSFYRKGYIARNLSRKKEGRARTRGCRCKTYHWLTVNTKEMVNPFYVYMIGPLLHLKYNESPNIFVCPAPFIYLIRAGL